jgi:hypothetical protein
MDWEGLVAGAMMMDSPLRSEWRNRRLFLIRDHPRDPRGILFRLRTSGASP